MDEDDISRQPPDEGAATPGPVAGMDEAAQVEGLPVRGNVESPPLTDFLHNITALLKQKKHKEGLALCDEALSIHPDAEKLLEKKVKALCQLHQFHSALGLVTGWLGKHPQSQVAVREETRLRIILEAVEASGGDSDTDQGETDTPPAPAAALRRGSTPTHPSSASTHLPSTTTHTTTQQPSSSLQASSSSQPTPVQSTAKSEDKNVDIPNSKIPTVLDIPASTLSAFSSFRKDGAQFRNKSEDSPASVTPSSYFMHRQRMELADTHKWLFRAPPRGLASEEYGICKRFKETGRCQFGEKCTQAHSEAELEEWNHRYAVRKQQRLESRDPRTQGATYTDQLLEKLMSQEPPKMLLVENMDLVKVHENSDLKISASMKKCTNAWTFTVTSKLCLHCVALMTDHHRSYFHVSSISVGPRKTQKYQNLEAQCQEWVNQDTLSKGGQGEFVYRVKVVFKTDIYGTFRQTIVFDFGVDMILMREVQVESAPASDPEKIRKEITLSEAQRWNEKTVTLVNFEPKPPSHSGRESSLLSKYSLPTPEFCPSETVMQTLNKSNYRLWMHQMLYIEELDQVRYVSRFNVTTSLSCVNRYLLLPSTLSTARYAHGGELFARLELEDDLSEDSMAGRLVLQASQSAWIAEGKKERPGRVYEAFIEDKGKNFIFMRLSKTCVEELGLSCDQDFTAQIQFQLNRVSMCEMHSAVDRLPTLDIVFPELEKWDKMADQLKQLGDTSVELQEPGETKRLNEKQKDAVRLILARPDLLLPPLLIVGPFGTGKTFTLAQAAKQVLKQGEARILICCHSNSAADLYIKEFLHDYSTTSPEARPLRIMYKYRWLQTVPEVVLDYTLWDKSTGMFREPSVEDVMAHRIIITTLSSSRCVADLDLPKDAFTHIFIDEAAQSLESETLIPLSVANEKTRIIFAGDHMQMSPEVYSGFTRQQGFHTSLLERLHELYPKECVFKVMLCENYRAHAAIIDFTSELFYDNKLQSSGSITAHDQFYPLTFYAAKGEEIHHENSTGFYNLAEVYEIVERVDELKKKWPEAWGPFDSNGISVVAPYSDQVARIRMELKKRKLFNVNVERVLNVQGKQYRAILLSITRTRLTCRPEPNMEDYMDFGFLSNIKLLNTAITRAQSLVVVVGDPVSVCLVGKCRKIWEYFLEICHDNGSLHGISWVPLREQLDRAELTKSFVLNPLAAEFVPNRQFHSSTAGQHDPHAGVFHGVPQFNNLTAHAGYPLPGQYLPHPAMYAPPFYQQPVYSPYLPNLLPTMIYPPVFGAARGGGFLPGKQMLPHYVTPPSARHHPNNLHPHHRTVDMPGVSRNLRPSRTPPRHLMYSQPRPFPPLPTAPGFPPLLQQPGIPPGGYFYLPESFPHHPHHPYIHPSFSPHAALKNPAGLYGGIPTHPNLQPAHSPSPQPATTPPHPGPSPRDTDSPRLSDSPSLSAIQLLPNVKHVPAHLLGKPDSSAGLSDGEQNSSGAVKPAATSASKSGNSGFPPLRPDPPLSQRPYSPANYSSHRERSGSGEIQSLSRSYSPVTDIPAADRSAAKFLRDRHRSGEADGHSSRSYSPANFPTRDERRSSGEDTSSGHERSMSISPPSLQPSQQTNGSQSRQSGVGSDLHKNHNNQNKRPRPSLKLNTGFSRQFSEDLPTPTVITHMIQMIDDNIDEEAEDEWSPAETPDSDRKLPGLKLRMTVAQRLQHRQATEGSEASSSSSPPSSGDAHPSYRDMVARASEGGRGVPEQECRGHLEVQTPRTPKGFITPGAEGEVDPFGILKSLNIGGTPQ